MISSGDDLCKQFLNTPYTKYKLYQNSSKNKRGVGILIKHDLQIEILEEFRTDDENVFGLRAVLHGSEVLLVSVYGPNNQDYEFYQNILDLLHLNEDVPIILGGDWNCLFSQDPVSNNIDCINMNRLPNHNNGIKLSELCEIYNLTDPFRFLYPENVEFTYVPRNVTSNNRSRLDFF
jgi:exonuclease III